VFNRGLALFPELIIDTFYRFLEENTKMHPKMGSAVLVSMMMKLKRWTECHLLLIRGDKK
jgi:hypothetical protein